jgi:PIN domain nuclease of toxin-antitoxin system
MLVSKGRLQLSKPVEDWVADALAPPEMRLLDLTREIAVASTKLPGTFHPDPADRMIVATARAWNVGLVTLDGAIRQYPHVKTLP